MGRGRSDGTSPASGAFPSSPSPVAAFLAALISSSASASPPPPPPSAGSPPIFLAPPLLRACLCLVPAVSRQCSAMQTTQPEQKRGLAQPFTSFFFIWGNRDRRSTLHANCKRCWSLDRARVAAWSRTQGDPTRSRPPPGRGWFVRNARRAAGPAPERQRAEQLCLRQSGVCVLPNPWPNTDARHLTCDARGPRRSAHSSGIQSSDRVVPRLHCSFLPSWCI